MNLLVDYTGGTGAIKLILVRLTLKVFIAVISYLGKFNLLY